MEKFWNFIKNESDNTAELLLYGTISDNSWWSDSVSPKRFKEDLEKLGNVTQITVRIYSGGGDVFAANAIYSMLKDHKAEIIVKIDGLAASAATIIAMSGDKILIPENGYMMIHKVSTYISGNIDDIQKELELLEKIENTLVQTYVKRTGKTKEEVQALIDAETWLTGREAVEEGFADELMFENEEEKEKISNGILNKIEGRNDLEKWKNLHENLKNILISKNNTNKIINDSLKYDRKEGEIMDEKTLKEKYPDLYNSIYKAGAINERQRLKDIDLIANNISKELVEKAKYEDFKNAQELSFEAMKNEKIIHNAMLNAMSQDAQIVNTVPGAVEPISEKDSEKIEKEFVQNIAKRTLNK